jgi:hypothetical protein
MSSEKTAVGTVDTTVLARLEREFDTRRITEAGRFLAGIHFDTSNIESWCKDLSKLHNMAMYLIKHDDLHGPIGKEPIYELADRLSSELSEWQERIDEACNMLDELAQLAPEDLEDYEELDGEGKEDDEDIDEE